MGRSIFKNAGLASLGFCIGLSILAWPFLLLSSVVPFIGFVALPTLLSISLFILYSTTWLAYLFFEFDGRLPWNPVRCWRVDTALLRLARDAWRLSVIELGLDLSYRRLMISGGKEAKQIVVDGVLYGASSGPKRLDLYLPASALSDEDADPAPIIVFVPGGGWMLRKRALFTQLALRLRAIGYAVVIPDLAAFPDGKCTDMIVDLRHVLEWTARHAEEYRIDPEQIYLMGHGSGAHLALLTVVQEAVVRSRDEFVLSQFEHSLPKGKPPAEDLNELPAGVRRLEIAGENVEMPEIRGLILLGAIADVIKLVRYEARRGVEQLSPLRRALGPSHAACLMASPSHLLYGAKQVLDPSRLPQRILLLHGGADVEVPISQSVLLKSLLTGVGVRNVKLRAYRELSHLEALTSLMRPPKSTKYGTMLVAEIVALISGAEETPKSGDL